MEKDGDFLIYYHYQLTLTPIVSTLQNKVNPRVQVEHTVTEQVTGIDIVQTTFLIAGGNSCEEIGLVQDKIVPRGVAIQCRITTEDPVSY